MIRSKSLPALIVFAALAAFAGHMESARASNDNEQSPVVQNEATPDDAQAEAPSPRSPLRVNSVNFDDATGKLSVAGIALPGNELFLFFDDQPLAKVVPNDGGQWSLESDLKMNDGRHTLRAEQYDPVTRMLAARAMVSIERAKQPPDEAPKTP